MGKKRRLSRTQENVVDLMRKGHRLWKDRDGFALNGVPVRATTVSALLAHGYIKYDGREHDVQLKCGMESLGLPAVCIHLAAGE